MGRQSGFALLGSVICGKRKSGYGFSPERRANGPPRSSSQYQMPKAITLVTKIAAPPPSRTAALLLISPLRMGLARTTADALLSTVIAAVRIRLAHRPAVVGREIRTG